ncbi:MAG: pyridoxal phosphate-dependent aminotransferase [Bacteroidota bacterium]|jgi:aspartate aminotransferase|nr:pyridoxal phosphate-dependent aminotransferase [Bacteroidota bacterium]MCA6443321.1 pyridoxal phosphate-dependent aminotransferase [Bacteroidota bacterium]
MSKLSNRVNAISESQTIAMARKSRELKAKGVDIISLSLGEPDFATPQIIKEAAKKAIDDNFSYYTHVSGYIELREAICKKFKRDNNLDYSPDEIVVSTGAKQSIANAVLCLVNDGDEVIVPAPYWVSYLEILKLAGGKPVIINTEIESDYKLSADQLKKAITSKTKLIMISTPCNPTGSVYSQQELKELAKVVAEYPDLYILSDEIYEHINFIGGHQSFAQFDFIKDRVITINGVSKGFAMTGWRGGIMAAPKWIAQACDKMQGQFTSATCSITQKAMHKAMELDYETYIKPMTDEFLKRRNLVLELMKDIKGLKTNVPEGAFYVYPEVSYYFGKQYNNFIIKNATDLSLYLLDEAHVALVPGAAFGEDNYIRFSYATNESILKEALKRMKKALDQLV